MSAPERESLISAPETSLASCVRCRHIERFHYPPGRGCAENELRLCQVYTSRGVCQCRGFAADWPVERSWIRRLFGA